MSDHDGRWGLQPQQAAASGTETGSSVRVWRRWSVIVCQRKGQGRPHSLHVLEAGNVVGCLCDLDQDATRRPKHQPQVELPLRPLAVRATHEPLGSFAPLWRPPCWGLPRTVAAKDGQVGTLLGQQPGELGQAGRLVVQVGMAGPSTPSVPSGRRLLPEPTPHRAPPRPLVGPTPHRDTPPPLVGPTPHRDTSPPLVGPTPHRDTSAPVVGPTPHRDTPPPLVGPTSHRDTSPSLVGPTPHRDTPPPLVGPTALPAPRPDHWLPVAQSPLSPASTIPLHAVSYGSLPEGTPRVSPGAARAACGPEATGKAWSLRFVRPAKAEVNNPSTSTFAVGQAVRLGSPQENDSDESVGRDTDIDSYFEFLSYRIFGKRQPFSLPRSMRPTPAQQRSPPRAPSRAAEEAEVNNPSTSTIAVGQAARLGSPQEKDSDESVDSDADSMITQLPGYRTVYKIPATSRASSHTPSTTPSPAQQRAPPRAPSRAVEEAERRLRKRQWLVRVVRENFNEQMGLLVERFVRRPRHEKSVRRVPGVGRKVNINLQNFWVRRSGQDKRMKTRDLLDVFRGSGMDWKSFQKWLTKDLQFMPSCAKLCALSLDIYQKYWSTDWDDATG